VIQNRVIDVKDAAHYADRVNKLREYHTSVWGGGLSTLGLALYQMDHDLDAYFASARRLNKILWREFGPLYKQVFSFLENTLGNRVMFLDGSAFPGFHIIETGNDGTFWGGMPHFDLSYQSLCSPTFSELSPTDQYSFTLALQSPAGAVRTDIWNLEYDSALEKYGQDFDRMSASSDTPPRPYLYHPGEMIVFRSDYMHRIGEFSSDTPDLCRVTLQGHALKCPRGWAVYW